MKLSFILLLFFCLSCSQIRLLNQSNNTQKNVKTTSRFDKKNAFGTVQDINKLKINVVKKVLPNGLVVLLIENNYLPVFSFHTFYKVGARDEQKGLSGASHFLEHLMFKGTRNFSAGNFDHIIEGNGGTSNAYTTWELTSYYESLPSTALETIVQLEADRMHNLLIDERSFEKERKVILEERKFRYENSPRGKIHLKMMQEVFKNTPYGGSIIGTIKDLKSVKREQIYQYYKENYAPENAVICLVGSFNVEKTIRLFEKYYGHIPRSAKVHKIKSPKKKLQGRSKLRRNINIHGNSPAPLFRMAFKGSKLDGKDSIKLEILASILGAGESSYLFQKFVVGRRNFLSRVNAVSLNFLEAGAFYITGELFQGVSIRRFKQRLVKSLRNVCQTAITKRSLIKAKNQHLVSYFSALETNSGIAEFIGNREVLLNDYNYYKKEIREYNRINVNDIKNVCEKYINLRDYTFITLWKNFPKTKRG